MATNAQILGAIVNKWAQPLIGTFVNQYMGGAHWLQAIQNKIRSTGWVSSNWSLIAELSPLMEGVSGSIITPMLTRYLSQVDDVAIPAMAHAIVDKAMESGEIRLFEGKVIFEANDLQQLKRLLELNLPLKAEDSVNIITD